MTDIWSFVVGLLPSIITSIVLFYWQKSQNKKEERAERHAQERREEARKEIDLLLATAKLSYATAMALKRGQVNGEMENAIKLYNAAEEEFKDFERELLVKVQART